MNQDPEKQSAVDCFRATVTDALVVACCCHVYIRPASGAGIDFIASIPLRSARMIIRQILALVLITHVTTNFETDHNEQSRKSSRRNCANDCSPVFCCVSRRKNMFVSWFFSTIWLSFFAALVGIAFFVVQNPNGLHRTERLCNLQVASLRKQNSLQPKDARAGSTLSDVFFHCGLLAQTLEGWLRVNFYHSSASRSTLRDFILSPEKANLV